MEEELQLCLDVTKDSMEHAIKHLEKELVHIRAGKAAPSMLDGVLVEYYGTNTPLGQVANIGTSDARTIVIQPWDKKIIPDIEKAILKANLGFNPDNNGEVIRINVPVLTEERRRLLVKQVRAEGENTKVSIRATRKDANEELKKLKKEGLAEDSEKRGEEEVQEMTTKYTKKVDELMEKKEREIMTV